MLRELGHQVTTASISPYRTDAGANDILLDPYQNNWVFRVPSHFELRLARAASFSEAIRGRVGQIFQQAAPEVLWLEHPFLWSVFKPIASSLGLPVVYSSHNVEWKTKTFGCNLRDGFLLVVFSLTVALGGLGTLHSPKEKRG